METMGHLGGCQEITYTSLGLELNKDTMRLRDLAVAEILFLGVVCVFRGSDMTLSEGSGLDHPILFQRDAITIDNERECNRCRRT